MPFAMPGLHHPVHFTRSAPFEVSPSHLIFYDVVELSAVSRSSVLSCLAEASGEARLPDTVVVSDFRKWLDAVADSPAEFRSRNFTSMCTALKVADAVDDIHIDEWVHLAGKSLAQAALQSRSVEFKSDILQGLAHLTDNLQHRVFAAAAFDASTLNTLLAFFPTRLHAPVLTAMITPGKSLHMLVGTASRPALKALASLPASPASLLSLQCDDVVTYGKETESYETCKHLAEALHHHTGLTALLLQPRVDTSHQLLFPTIATLTTLQSLECEYSCTLPEDEPTLKQTLRALPQLQHLRLRVGAAMPASNKRKRDTDRATTPQCCLADTLSPATALTSLSLNFTEDVGSRFQDSHLIAAGPLALPHLVQLTALFDLNLHLAASFFAHLNAPLTSLKLTEGLQHPGRVRPAAAPAVQQLLHSLAAFTELRCFSAALPTDQGRGSSILDALTTAVPDTLAAFLQLQSFTLAAEPTMVYRSVMVLPMTATALTELRLGIYHPRDSSTHDLSFTETWPQFFFALRMFDLQHLELDWEVHRPTGHGLSSLMTLTEVTALRVRGWACVHGPANWQALARMTRLQQLCIEHTEEDFTLPCGCIATIAALSTLTSIALITSAADSDLVPILVDTLEFERQSLPALQELALSSHHPFAAEALVCTASTLRALTRLTLHLFPPADFTPAPEDSDDDEDGEAEMRHSAFEDLERETADLESIAARKGLPLTINTDAYYPQYD